MSHPPAVVEDRVPLAETQAPFHPYVPASQSPTELTARALILGSVLGIVFAASSVFLAVKVGITVSASIPVAVLSIAFFRAFGKSSILENTIVQTTGSAGESLAFGVAAALPALLLMGYDIDLVHAFLVAALGGILGVLMMIPLRHGLIVQEHGKLAYPEGTACADVLVVGEQGGTNARTVIVGFLIGTFYKLAYSGLHLWRETIEAPLSWVGKNLAGKTVEKGFLGASISAEISPELLGVGYIIGPKVAGVTFAGGVLSYLILIPAIKFFGGGLTSPLVAPDGMLIRDMSPDVVRNHYILYIGAGAVATGGLISLLRSFPTIVSAFRRGLANFLASRRKTLGGPSIPRTDQDLPITVVIVGALGLVLTIWLAPPLHVNLISSLLIIVFGFFFVTVSARITGEIGSSSNPISGMVVATLLVTCLIFLLLGWTSPADRFMALTTAAIVGIAASNGGTTAQDLKTAFLVGGTPRKQQISLFVGVISSALVIGLTLVAINKGETAIVPEEHPGQKLTVVGKETMVQHELRFTLDDAKLAAKGWSHKQLSEALYTYGDELVDGPQGAATTVRSFDVTSEAELRGRSFHPQDGRQPVTLSELGEVTALPDRVYTIGYARGESEVLAGKYLTDGGGVIRYVIDPGIGGRISEFRGKKFNHYQAPKARLFALIIDGSLTQRLPWDLVLLGVFIALMLELCGVSALAFAVGVYLPISTTTPIFVGGVVRHLVDRARGAEAEFSPGTLLSSGYIAGGSIAGVALAIVKIAGGDRWERAINVPLMLAEHGGGAVSRFINAIGDSEMSNMLASNVWGLILFLGLAGFLLRSALKGRSGAETPPVR